MRPHPVTECSDPHLLCPFHDRPFYPRNHFDQEPAMPEYTWKADVRQPGYNPGTGSGTVSAATREEAERLVQRHVARSDPMRTAYNIELTECPKR